MTSLFDVAQTHLLDSLFTIQQLVMRLFYALWCSVNFFCSLHSAFSAPEGFPISGNGLWYKRPADIWAREWLPVGNGYLGAMIQGGTAHEAIQLNIESLWSGGPFADPSYNGGNKRASLHDYLANEMQRIRQAIFRSPDGVISNLDALGANPGQYGSFAGAGYLLSSLDVSGDAKNYFRWLDLDQGLAKTAWTQDGLNLLRTSFCSHPLRACIQHISGRDKPLSTLIYAFSSHLEPNLPAPNITCKSQSSFLVSGHVASSSSMAYAFLFRVFSSTPGVRMSCTQIPVPFGAPFNGTLQVTFPANSTSSNAWIAWEGETDYNINAGTAATNYSFRGEDPVSKLSRSTVGMSPMRLQDFDALLREHVDDIKSTLYGTFSLDLGQKVDPSVPTDVLKTRYAVDGPADGNVYLEWLLFNYGRYLLVSSARGALPANLQGIWANGVSNAWSADYHANINLQMNYWAAEMTGLGNLTSSLYDYIEKTWAPRGHETAEVLYNITRGWVTHDEMNIFGHTGMKSSGSQWANYPEANAWMMLHVWDHFDYTGDLAWWKSQGWPLLKGVASFHLDKLIPDAHFNDSTLVVNPCNSPEQNPITFGCAHAQQLIWQLFNSIEKGFEASGDSDTAFLDEIRDKRNKMDKGITIGSWGQLQEWKVDRDDKNNTHRHLSHLVGLYPGYAIANFDPSSVQGNDPASAKSYAKPQVLDAARISLEHRGDGKGPDANSGWEKVWRAAAWGQLGNSTQFYHELSYALSENFGANLFSLYNPSNLNTSFQIDANLGFPAALLNGLIQAPDVASYATPITVRLLPALPTQWPSGSIRGARIRGALEVDISWRNGLFVEATLSTDAKARPRDIIIEYNGRVLAQYRSEHSTQVRVAV